MRALPDLTNEQAMAERGRRSALMSARNDAAEELRNVFVAVQNADMRALGDYANALTPIAARLAEISMLWERLK